MLCTIQFTKQPFKLPKDSGHKFKGKNGNLVFFIDKNNTKDRYSAYVDQLSICWQEGDSFTCFLGTDKLRDSIKKGRIVPIELWDSDFSSEDLFNNVGIDT